MKFYYLKLTAIILIFVVSSFFAGLAWPRQTRTSTEIFHQAYEQGRTAMVQEIADCSLEDAHRELCFIPCSTDLDCVEKNGQEDH